MRKLLKTRRWLAAGLATYVVGGCVSSPQLTDFLRTEVARVASDIIGQSLLIFVQAVSGLSGIQQLFNQAGAGGS